MTTILFWRFCSHNYGKQWLSQPLLLNNVMNGNRSEFNDVMTSRPLLWHFVSEFKATTIFCQIAKKLQSWMGISSYYVIVRVSRKFAASLIFYTKQKIILYIRLIYLSFVSLSVGWSLLFLLKILGSLIRQLYIFITLWHWIWMIIHLIFQIKIITFILFCVLHFSINAFDNRYKHCWVPMQSRPNLSNYDIEQCLCLNLYNNNYNKRNTVQKCRL